MTVRRIPFPALAGNTQTPLGFGVLKILLLRTQKQMIWSNAQPIITMMTDEQAVCDLAVVDQPRRAVRADSLGAAM